MERALVKAQEHARSGWKVGIGVALAVVAALAALAVLLPRFVTSEDVRSLAVLPFVPADAETAHLADGLSRDVVRELQRFDVQVRRASGEVAAAAIGDVDLRVGADAVLAATAQRDRATTRLRVTVRHAASAPFWIQDYDIEDGKLPSISRTIAQNVAEAIGARLRAGAPAPAHQTNYRAYDAYQRGRILSEQRNPVDLMRSLEYFAEASKLDPAYPEPWAGMADSYMALGVPPFGELRPMEARRLAKEAALRSLDLNPNLAEAHTSLAWAAALYDWDWDVAETRFKRAIELNPQYALAHHWYAMFLTDMGRFDEARAELRLAQSLEPLSLLIHRDFGWIHFIDGRYAEAIAQLRETLARDPQYSAAITLLARSLAAEGQTAEALAELERARPDVSRGSYLSFRGYIEAIARDPRARQTLAELHDTALREYVTPYYFALIYTALGQPENAILELERAYAEQDSTLGSVNVDPRFDPLRTEPRFRALIEAMRFPAARR
jgi:tetratricopeptide (TPR) repeat protein